MVFLVAPRFQVLHTASAQEQQAARRDTLLRPSIIHHTLMLPRLHVPRGHKRDEQNLERAWGAGGSR